MQYWPFGSKTISPSMFVGKNDPDASCASTNPTTVSIKYSEYVTNETE